MSLTKAELRQTLIMNVAAVFGKRKSYSGYSRLLEASDNMTWLHFYGKIQENFAGLGT